MKLFDIFDWRGEKIASVHEAGDPLDGIGCFASVFITFVVVAGAFIIWPVFYDTLRRGIKAGETGEVIQMSVWILSILTIMGVSIGRNVKDGKKKFLEIWLETITMTTMIGGIVVWLMLLLTEGFSFGIMIGAFFLSFLLSIGSGFAAAVVTKVAVYFKKQSKANTAN